LLPNKLAAIEPQKGVEDGKYAMFSPTLYCGRSHQFFSRDELLVLHPVFELSRQIALAILAAPEAELVEANVPGRSGPTYKVYLARRPEHNPF
jgi:hypothetical protein